MPTFLSDPSMSTYVILATFVVILGIIAARRQKKGDIATFVVALLLLIGLYAADQSSESPREIVQRQIGEMASAAQAKKYDDLFKHVSENFKYKSYSKKDMREKAKLAETQMPEGFEAWDIKPANFKQIDDNTVEQGFLAQPKGGGVNVVGQRYVVATFKKEGDGWKMVEFKFYNPIQRTNAAEEAIPGL